MGSLKKAKAKERKHKFGSIQWVIDALDSEVTETRFRENHKTDEIRADEDLWWCPECRKKWNMFEGEGANAGNFQANQAVNIGAIMIGKYYDMPNSPDLNVKRTIAYDNNKVSESLGGQKYGHMINLGRTATSTSKSPFVTASNKYNIHGGKIQYDMSFSYLNSTDVMPDEYHTVQHGDSNFISDVWNITDGNHRPFIFSADNGSTGDGAESEHIFARFDQNKLDMSQVAPDVFNMKLKIEEEF